MKNKSLKENFWSFLRSIVMKHDAEFDDYRPNYICTSFDTRNRYKNDEYKIPYDEPQCPIYGDNRCCGDCKYTEACEHMVNCNCHGIVKTIMGGTSESTMMRKASDYYKYGRMIDENTFDWDYFHLNRNKKRMESEPFMIIKIGEKYYVAEKIGKFTKKNKFMVYIKALDKSIRITMKDLKSNVFYESYEKCERFNKCYLDED